LFSLSTACQRVGSRLLGDEVSCPSA
jgi:hypothetical protein